MIDLFEVEKPALFASAGLDKEVPAFPLKLQQLPTLRPDDMRLRTLVDGCRMVGG